MSEPGLYLYRLTGPAFQEMIDASLLQRGITHACKFLPSGWRLYKIAKVEAHKLPRMDGEPYLGDDETGFSLWDNPVWENDYPDVKWVEMIHVTRIEDAFKILQDL